jgi:hypothetical protein
MGAMRRDIDEALEDWGYEPDDNVANTRQVRARDGRWVVQVRQELGVLQMEVDGRPDGVRPHGFKTYLDYLRHRAADRRQASGTVSPSWAMSREHAAEVDREVVQFYHRRMAWLALHRYDRMLEDGRHTLALMDFVRRHSEDEEFIASHERFRGLVLFHCTQASAAMALERRRPEEAIDVLREGMEKIERHQGSWQAEHAEENETPNMALMDQLREIEREIRRCFDVRKTLREELDEAISIEDYERAARIRDEMRGRSRSR